MSPDEGSDNHQYDTESGIKLEMWVRKGKRQT